MGANRCEAIVPLDLFADWISRILVKDSFRSPSVRHGAMMDLAFLLAVHSCSVFINVLCVVQAGKQKSSLYTKCSLQRQSRTKPCKLMAHSPVVVLHPYCYR